MKCRCEQCSDDPLYTYSESWRHETEVKMIMGKRLLVDRRSYIDGVERIRGIESVNKIRNDLLKLWKK
jgi:hypothetical protein